ncbi:MAG: peptidylprolyl isomerase [Roseovarius sp.]|nr:peptidylprolyl isomerase [Roseovarius sp.]
MKFRPTFLAAATLVIATLHTIPALSQDTPSANTVLATIDDTDITLGHMIALRSSLPPHYDQLENDVLFDGILSQLIQHTLLAQSLEDGPSRRSLLLIENESRAIAASEAVDAVTGTTITDAQIEAAYKSEYLQTEPDTEYNAAHILVETKEEATSLVQKLAEGGDFAALAQEFSTGPSGPNGGDLGWFSKGVMVEPFFDAVVALDAGQVSDPVKTQFGWHIIKLLETRSQDRPELADVREQLESSLREEAFETHIANLEKAAKIDRPDISAISPDILNNIDLLEK